MVDRLALGEADLELVEAVGHALDHVGEAIEVIADLTRGGHVGERQLRPRLEGPADDVHDSRTAERTPRCNQ